MKGSGVSVRSQRMKMPANVGQKKIKGVEQLLQELSVGEFSPHLKSYIMLTPQMCFKEIINMQLLFQNWTQCQQRRFAPTSMNSEVTWFSYMTWKQLTAHVNLSCKRYGISMKHCALERYTMFFIFIIIFFQVLYFVVLMYLIFHDSSRLLTFPYPLKPKLDHHLKTMGESRR